MLSVDDFKFVVDKTPLVSLDLVVQRPDGKVLLGKRINKPAQGVWFVPGGRVLKNERLGTAFKRLVMNEIGPGASIRSVRYLGLYEHFYKDSMQDEKISTHYVVNAFAIELERNVSSLPKDQHSEYCWLSRTELLEHQDVHVHSKWYFQNNEDDSGFCFGVFGSNSKVY